VNFLLSKSWKDSHSSCLLAHCSPLPKGTLKLNINGNLLEDSGILGVGGIVLYHEVDWIVGFSHWEVGGDALLTKLGVTQTGLDFCHSKDYNYIICESDCLKSIEMFIFIVIISCTFMLLTSFILEMFYMRMVTLH
jgi:hypothetical protein